MELDDTTVTPVTGGFTMAPDGSDAARVTDGQDYSPRVAEVTGITP